LLYGDVNDDGAVNIQDVVMVMQHTLEFEKLADKQKLYADVNNDGTINILDVSLIMQKTLGLVEGFPGLPQPEADLVKDFIVADGVAPGKKLVVVTLTVLDPQSYRVYVAGETLVYSSAVAGFSGEIGEENALQSKVAVLKR
ncbi:MAG: dockerin type I repeat-containing protein, partial [Dethiobacteria bacterium]|nr:dockerin type I repeat-containing protein [Dethiobacteria bacterium]